MSQYNKTVLTNAGLELAKRANAGQAKFGITRAVTSADDWSNKTIQDIEAVTTIPNIMQQGTIMDTEEVESNNLVMGVSLCFTNKNLSAGYQIKIIGVYVKEEGQENDFLYAVTTAVSPEYMPDFNDKVLYRFNMQLYLVIGKAQAVNVVINDGASVTHGQFDKYKGEVTASLEKIENAHKEDMSHVVKSASINGGDEILPNETGKLELVVPDPDLSKYVSLEQLTEALKTKADKTTVEENLATKANQSDLDKTNAEVVKKADSADVTAQLDTKADKTDVANSVKQLQAGIDSKADKSVVDAEIAKIDFTPYAKTVDVDSKLSGYTSTADLTKLLNAKANTVDVYSRSELDKKLLEMSADTDGKVNADQVANMIAGKADKTAVDAELAKKDDTTDVDAKINSNVTKLNQAINAKANAFDVYTKPQIDTAFGQRDTKIGNNTNVINTINEALKLLIPDDTHAPALPAGFDLNNYFVGWRRSVNTTLKNMPFGWLNDTMYFQGTVAGSDGRFEIALYIGDGSNTNPKIAYRFYGWGNWKPWVLLADNGDISNLQNQIQQLRESQFEVQTFTDANAAANWEAQRPGHRLAIVNK